MTQIKVGDRMFTKDGRKVGNGIIVDVVLGLTDVAWAVETDFGNKMVLTEPELTEFYHVGWHPEVELVELLGEGEFKLYDHSLEEWVAARRRNVMGEEQ